ncbi:peptide deformylase [Tuberibacillus sp. Marseille-P3662]|uniref:peptide deformylase n=1 Tax=Tuberibacillus sp. Marseille-P3662 TaxID=1965358 RepID=UPI000A1CA7DE|nr:peptide deformylase [Tuberibacillus sp. Marseille-P3662]
MTHQDKHNLLTMKDIVKEGDPILRTVTDNVAIPPSDEDKQILNKMMQFIKNSQDETMAKKYQLRPGVGLSANQLGFNKRMFAAYLTDEKEQLHEYAWINPKIISHSVQMTYMPYGEGCLSVDRQVPGYVPRYDRIKVRAYDIEGQEVTVKLKGHVAIVVQHEIDHLNGIMFYDHINQDNPFELPDDVAIKSLY